jgi:hypothetical protein
MSYDGTKLVYFDGKPQWLMPDGSFVPVEYRNDGSYAPGSLSFKEKSHEGGCSIADQGM